MRSAAQATAAEDPRAATAASKACKLGLNEGGHAGQIVCNVVDQHMHIYAVNRIKG